MKNSILSLLLVLIYCSCQQASSKKHNPPHTAASSVKSSLGIKQLSLNNIPESEVRTMIDTFASTIYEKVIPRTKVTYWFSRDVIEGLEALLKKEQKGNDGSKYGVTDGFRIYFISQGPDKTHISLALVSTKNFGRDSTNPGFIYHKDYYEHEASHPLFSLDGVGGKEGTGNCDGGAMLYTTCKKCRDDNCQIAPRHRVTREYAETMTGLFGNDKINSRSVWFDYDLLRQLVTSGLNYDGIRIYFGNYGKTDFKGDTLELKYKDHDTVILMPTKRGSKIDIHNDMFDCEGKTTLWSNLFLEGYNNGQLCPTHCN